MKGNSKMEPLVNFQLYTNEISIKNNKLPVGEFKIAPKFTRRIGTVDSTHMCTELKVEMINTEETPFPVDITICLTGVFDISKLDKKDVDQFMQIQTVHVMLPYIRSMVSNITSSALMPPIQLPIYDAAKLFDQ